MNRDFSSGITRDKIPSSKITITNFVGPTQSTETCQPKTSQNVFMCLNAQAFVGQKLNILCASCLI
uniref:Uncharacterized protein n=1 Tax=Rhizophora mucronata TaxID=61149 RepID=A0A2P2LRB7_RHIMU